MERKYININELKNVLSPKELKNVKGGSGGQCGGTYCEGHEGEIHCLCQNDRWCMGICG